MRLTDELAQLIKRVIKIEYEILQGEKGDARAGGHPGAADHPGPAGASARRGDPRRRRARHLAVHRRVLARRARLLPRQDRQQVPAQRARRRAVDGRGARRRPRGGGEGGGAPAASAVAAPRFSRRADRVSTFGQGRRCNSGVNMTIQLRVLEGIFARPLSLLLWPSRAGRAGGRRRRDARQQRQGPLHEAGERGPGDQTNLTKPEAPPPPKKETRPDLTVDQFVEQKQARSRSSSTRRSARCAG